MIGPSDPRQEEQHKPTGVHTPQEAVVLWLVTRMGVRKMAWVLGATATAWDFETYKWEHGKAYDVEEDGVRRGLFEAKVAEIEAHNKAGSSLYKKGVNTFSDMTLEERRAWLGRDKQAAWEASLQRNQQETAVERPHHHRPGSTTRRLSAPATLDWRDSKVISPVKNQGSCGSCWAHASTESIESYVALATGEAPPILSVQQLVSCAENAYTCGGTGGCEGSIPELAFTYAQLYGMALNESWPYVGEDTNCASFGAYASISGYAKLPVNDYDAVIAALVDVGPLAINVDASDWHSYESGIYDGCSASNTSDLNHVVQLVGYGYDADLDQNYWTVRNSWGTSYGEDGYIRLLRPNDGQSPTCADDVTPLDGTGCAGGTASQYVCGECGLLFDVSYPLGAALVPSSTGAQAPHHQHPDDEDIIAVATTK